MTAAVSAGPGGPEVLMQTKVGRAIQHGSRGGQSAPDSKAGSDDDGAPAPRLKENDSKEAPAKIDKTATSRRTDDKSDDDGASFEDTFETLGQEAINEAPPLPPADPVLPNIAIVQQTTDDSRPSSAPSADVTSNISQVSGRPTPMLKQASILALMNAKDRLLANADSEKFATAAQQDAAPTDHPTDRIQATVDRQETHWNFANNAITDSRLAAGPLVGNAPSAVQSAAVLASNSVAAAPATKSANAEPQPSSDAQPPAIPNTDLPPLALGGNPDGSAGGKGTQDGAQTAKQALSDAAPKKAAKDDTTPSLDKIFSTTSADLHPQSSPVSQVRDGIIASLKSPDADQSQNVQQPAIPTRPAAPSMLRSLDLTLSPPDLGAVKLHMSLKDNALTIEAQASKASTAQMLNDDRTSLEKGLRDAGYDVSSVKITDASGSASTNSNGWQSNGSQSRDSDQARSSFSGRQEGDMQRRDGGGSPSDQAQRRAKDTRPQPATPEVTSGRLGNAVYI